MRAWCGKALVVVAILFSSMKPAQAGSFGDAALTVGIAAGVGAVLGLSTLPFYADSGAHTKNIWIGAAIGAVIGVGFSAVTAVNSSDDLELEDDYEAANKRDFSFYRKNNSYRYAVARLPQDAPESRAAGLKVGPEPVPELKIWSPLATIHF